MGRLVRIAQIAAVGVALIAAAGCGAAPDPDPDVAAVAAAPPPSRGPDPDAAAGDELLARWQLGEAGAWRVDERFTRTRPDGEVLTLDLSVVRLPPGDVLVIGDGVAQGVLDGRVITCELGPEPRCTEPAAPVTFDPSVALDGVVGPAGYVVEAAGTATVAGEEADCYALTAPQDEGEHRLGDHAQLCLTADGIPVRVVVDHGGIVDRREAVAVDRTIERADVTALLAGA